MGSGPGGAAVPPIVWSLSDAVVEASAMASLMRDVGARDYDELWRWSVQDVARFWQTIWERAEIDADGSTDPVLASAEMPGATWFPNVRLSFPEHVFRGRRLGAAALHAAQEDGPVQTWTWAELRDATNRIRVRLQELGVEPGDRVAGFLPNVPETVAAFLATAALGATWSCCSPDFGAGTVVQRFAQIEPKVLLAVDGYRYGGREHRREAVVDEVRRALPTLKHVVLIPRLNDRHAWSHAFPPTDQPLTFTRVPFDHPLWIVYSSGTTGAPKAIVHGHGGPLLEHIKLWQLHHDAKPGDRVLWFTTTGWIMWNYLVGALLADASIVLYDGNPGHPDLQVLWDLADDVGVSLLGAGAAFFHGCMRAGVVPRDGRALANLRSVASTGSPLAPEAYRWVGDQLGAETWLVSTSGGTDIASAFLGGAPLVEVREGELPARMLGVAVAAFDEQGEPVVDEVGELVVTQPMPSMPVRFWNDPGDRRYRESYFEEFPGVWRHGDWIRITPRGSAVVYGRSDATINRGGIRIGTAELYDVVLAVDGIADALVVDVPPSDEVGDAVMTLFVVLDPHVDLTEQLRAEIIARLRADCSPRHLPDEIVAVPGVPRTLTGKLLEVPVKRLLMGRLPAGSIDRGSLADPESFDWFARYATLKDDEACA